MKSFLIKFWLPLAVASTIIMLSVYAVAQQNIRLSGNDPQIEMAEDGAAMLSGGLPPAEFVGIEHIDMAKSLSEFVIIYDDSGKPIASSGLLNGQIPDLPSGVFMNARSSEDRLTWQPASDVRIAAVVSHFDGKNPGFILAGRNMREIESRESHVGLIAASAWVAIIVLTFVMAIYAYVVEKKAEELGDVQ